MLKILLFILSVILGITAMLLVIYVARLKTSKSKSTYFYLRIKKLSIDFETANDKNKFDEYPLIKEQIYNLIKLIEDEKEFDVRKIIICKQKIGGKIGEEYFKRSIKLRVEYNICRKKNKKILHMLNEADEIKNEIIRYRMPIRSALDKYIFMIKLQILWKIDRVAIFIKKISLFLTLIFNKEDDSNNIKIKVELNKFEKNKKIVDRYRNDNKNNDSGFLFSREHTNLKLG